jgi:kynurenine 3-monooxygenase
MQHISAHEKITLVGAGLAGSLLAIFLAQRGFQVDVYERRADPRQVSGSAGRSINLAMSTRGLYALEQVGLATGMRQHAIPMRGRMIHTLAGEVHFQPYGKDDSEVLYAISRAELNSVLLNTAARYDNVHIRFQHRCLGINGATGALDIEQDATGQTDSLPPGRVIATDGAASAVRASMASLPRFTCSQDYLEHGYKELIIPPHADNTWQIEKNALHIWPRGTYMLIALPNLDGSFTCTLFLPFVGPASFASLSSDVAVLTFFHQQFPDAVPLMPSLVETFFANPTGSLVTIKCMPWHIADRVLLLGDAAHAIVPFYGQGMNCAFEDCTTLDACITRHWPDWERIFQDFTQQRKEHTDAIADMAIAHYVEMRDRVADAKFLLQKQLELELERKYPELFIPQYAMVTFHRTPYAIAQQKGYRQEAILQELCTSIDSLDEVDWDKADVLIKQQLAIG